MRMSVLCRELGNTVKYSLSPWEIPPASPMGFLSGSGYISQYITHLVIIQIQMLQEIFLGTPYFSLCPLNILGPKWHNKFGKELCNWRCFCSDGHGQGISNNNSIPMVWSSEQRQKLCPYRGNILRQRNSVYSLHCDFILEYHTINPVLVSCAYIQNVELWMIWKKLPLTRIFSRPRQSRLYGQTTTQLYTKPYRNRVVTKQKIQNRSYPLHTSHFWSLESLFIKSAFLELLRLFSQSEFTLYIGKLKCFKVENSPPTYLDLTRCSFFTQKRDAGNPILNT